MLNVRTFMGQSLSRRRRGHRRIASFLVGTALLIAGCSTVPTPSTPTASGLKPIDQAALQSLVDTTIKELLVPGPPWFSCAHLRETSPPPAAPPN
jgi:hypothetical protein